MGGIFFPGGFFVSFLQGKGFFCPDSAPIQHRFGPVRPFGPFRPGVVFTASGVVSPCRALLSLRRALLSPRRALLSPCQVLLSPRRVFLSLRRAMFSPRRGWSPCRALLSPAGCCFHRAGRCFHRAGRRLRVSASGRKKVRKPSASGLFFGLSVANYFARAFRLTSLAALSASFGFFEMALLS